MENAQKKGYKGFAASIKAKYPVYGDMDDMELAKKIIDKYPVYADQVSFDEGDGDVKKKKVQSMVANPYHNRNRKTLMTLLLNWVNPEWWSKILLFKIPETA